MNMATRSVGRCFAGSGRNWMGLAALILLVFIGAGFRLAVAYFLGMVVENGASGDFDPMLDSAIRLAGALLGSFLYGIFLSYGFALLVESFFSRLRAVCFQHVLHLPLDCLESRYTRGDLVVRINQDLTRLNDTIVGKWAWLGQVSITAMVSFVRCAVISWPLALLYGGLLVIFAGIMTAISRSTQRQHLEESAARAEAVQQAANILNAFDMVKAYQLEYIMEKRFDHSSQRMDGISVAIGDKLVQLGLIRYGLMLGTLLALSLAGGALLHCNRISLGELVSFLTLSQSIQSAVGLLDHIAYAIRIARADVSRINEVLRHPTEEEQWNMQQNPH